LPRRHPLDDQRPEDDVTARPESLAGGSSPDASATPPSDPPSSTPPPPAGGTGAPEEPLGLRAQVGATKEAAVGIARAHIELAKAEASEIGGEVARSAALGCLAVFSMVFIGLLLPIGTTLFLGEWLFGSMGWGILLGTELAIAIAVTAALVALRVTGVQWSFAAALVISAVLAIVLAFRLPRLGWDRLAQAVNFTFGAESGATPVWTGIIVMAIVGAIVGLALGSGRSGKAAIAGLVVGAVLGAIVGAFSAINFDRRSGAGWGLAIGFAIWPVLMAMRLARSGIDAEALKARYYPDVTIDTAKETLEWVRARTPLGPKS
jgi:hypothetical protein